LYYELKEDCIMYLSVAVGKLQLASYKVLNLELDVVPVGVTKPTINASLSTELNKIYNPYGVYYKVNIITTFDTTAWDLNSDNKLQVAGSGSFSQYTDEMLALNNAYKIKHPELAGNRQVLFAVQAADEENENLSGDMPLSSQFGYLICKNKSVTDLARTAAHELGHGLYQLKHIWDYAQEIKGTTNNLMDYTSDTHLMKFQWDNMFDKREMVFPEFQGEDVGKTLNELGWVNFYKETDETSLNTFLAPSGLPISIKGVLKQCLLTSQLGSVFYGSDIYSKEQLVINYERTNIPGLERILISEGEKYLYGFRVEKDGNYEEYLASFTSTDFLGYVKKDASYTCDPTLYKQSYQVHKWKGITSDANTSELWNVENSDFDPMSDDAILEKNKDNYLAAGALAVDLQNGLDKKYLSMQEIPFHDDTNVNSVNSFLAPSGLIITLEGTLLYCYVFTEEGVFDLPDQMRDLADNNSLKTIQVFPKVLYGFYLNGYKYLAKFNSTGFLGYFNSDEEINNYYIDTKTLDTDNPIKEYYFNKPTFSSSVPLITVKMFNGDITAKPNFTEHIVCMDKYLDVPIKSGYKAMGELPSNIMERFNINCLETKSIINPFTVGLPVFKALYADELLFLKNNNKVIKVIGQSFQAQIAIGLSLFGGSAISVSFSTAIDEFGNFAIIASNGNFGYLLAGLISINDNTFWNGNWILGFGANLSSSHDIYWNYYDVTQIAGESTNTDLNWGFINNAGLSLVSSDNTIKGISLSTGIGAGVSVTSITTNSTVFAINYKDLENMNNVIDKINADLANQDFKTKYSLLFVDSHNSESFVTFEEKPVKFVNLILDVKGFDPKSNSIETINSYNYIDISTKDNLIFSKNVYRVPRE